MSAIRPSEPRYQPECPLTQLMPCGFGSRICVGSSFARIEATAILATLARRVTLKANEQRALDLQTALTPAPRLAR